MSPEMLRYPCVELLCHLKIYILRIAIEIYNTYFSCYMLAVNNN